MAKAAFSALLPSPSGLEFGGGRCPTQLPPQADCGSQSGRRQEIDPGFQHKTASADALYQLTM